MDIASLKQLIVETKSKNPLTLTSAADKAAYNDELLQEITAHYFTAGTPQDFPEYLQGNFDSICKKTLKKIEAAKETLGEEAVNNIIAEANKICRVSNLHLTHDSQHDGSCLGSAENVDGILKDKALKSSYARGGDCDEAAQMVFLDMVINDRAKSTHKDHFLIKSIPNKLLYRSMPVVYNSTRHIPVGGQHFETAWLLATITAHLEKSETRRIHEGINSSAASALGEIQVPCKLDLKGHCFVKGGVEHIIEGTSRVKKNNTGWARNVAPKPDDE